MLAPAFSLTVKHDKTDATDGDIRDFDNDTMIVALVGPSQQRFSFHGAKLCGRLKWLDAFSYTHWAEGQPKQALQITLPEVDVELFRVYWEWVYSGTLSFRRCTPASDAKAKHAEYLLLVNLYKLGCSPQLYDVQLRNVAILELSKSLNACNTIPDQSLFAVVWSIAPRGEGLRTLLLDFMVAKGNRVTIGERLTQYSSAFIHELALAALNKTPIVVWQSATANGPRYLEPEEPEVNA